ncbi:hypothetical protein PR048_022441 [Dryococelus australis]|uniref:Uncharacterized protein n=1 Tax=Dryococelus australis TaxID=614101 RepID=A0ABQ9H108_9NEOP|nr:hypothetical protein PR048_022441 [Dryococelus australis]
MGLKCFGTAVSERLACSPPTVTNRVQSPVGSLPDFRMWESCRTMPLVGGFSRGSPVSPALTFSHHSHLVSASSAFKSHQNLSQLKMFHRGYSQLDSVIRATDILVIRFQSDTALVVKINLHLEHFQECSVIKGVASDVCSSNWVNDTGSGIYNTVKLSQMSKQSLSTQKKKTQAFYISWLNVDTPPPSLHLKGTTVPWQTQTKQLGILLDSTLQFKHHIKQAAGRAAGAIRELAPLLSPHSQINLLTRVTLFKSFITQLLTCRPNLGFNSCLLPPTHTYSNYKGLCVITVQPWTMRTARVAGVPYPVLWNVTVRGTSIPLANRDFALEVDLGHEVMDSKQDQCVDIRTKSLAGSAAAEDRIEVTCSWPRCIPRPSRTAARLRSRGRRLAALQHTTASPNALRRHVTRGAETPISLYSHKRMHTMSKRRTAGRLQSPGRLRRITLMSAYQGHVSSAAETPRILYSYMYTHNVISHCLLSHDKIDVQHVYTDVTFAIGSQIIRNTQDDSEPIADLHRNKHRVPYCQDKIDAQHMFTEFTFAIGSQIIRNAQDNSEPIANMQRNKNRVPYCQVWSNTGYSLGQQPMNTQLRLECTHPCENVTVELPLKRATTKRISMYRFFFRNNNVGYVRCCAHTMVADRALKLYHPAFHQIRQASLICSPVSNCFADRSMHGAAWRASFECDSSSKMAEIACSGMRMSSAHGQIPPNPSYRVGQFKIDCYLPRESVALTLKQAPFITKPCSWRRSGFSHEDRFGSKGGMGHILLDIAWRGGMVWVLDLGAVVATLNQLRLLRIEDRRVTDPQDLGEEECCHHLALVPKTFDYRGQLRVGLHRGTEKGGRERSDLSYPTLLPYSVAHVRLEETDMQTVSSFIITAPLDTWLSTKPPLGFPEGKVLLRNFHKIIYLRGPREHEQGENCNTDLACSRRRQRERERERPRKRRISRERTVQEILVALGLPLSGTKETNAPKFATPAPLTQYCKKAEMWIHSPSGSQNSGLAGARTVLGQRHPWERDGRLSCSPIDDGLLPRLTKQAELRRH